MKSGLIIRPCTVGIVCMLGLVYARERRGLAVVQLEVSFGYDFTANSNSFRHGGHGFMSKTGEDLRTGSTLVQYVLRVYCQLLLQLHPITCLIHICIIQTGHIYLDVLKYCK